MIASWRGALADPRPSAGGSILTIRLVGRREGLGAGLLKGAPVIGQRARADRTDRGVRDRSANSLHLDAGNCDACVVEHKPADECAKFICARTMLAVPGPHRLPAHQKVSWRTPLTPDLIASF